MQEGVNVVTKSSVSFSAKSPLRCNVNFQHQMMCICFSCLDFQGILLEKEALPFVVFLYLSLFMLI